MDYFKWEWSFKGKIKPRQLKNMRSEERFEEKESSHQWTSNSWLPNAVG